MAAQTKLAYSARSIQSLDNEQLLKLFKILGDDITRRIRNYASCGDPIALLDGVRFAKRAHRVGADLTHGGDTSLYGTKWRYGLHHAENTLVSCMADASFGESDIDGVNLDA
jgi:hypothetical protein